MACLHGKEGVLEGLELKTIEPIEALELKVTEQRLMTKLVYLRLAFFFLRFRCDVTDLIRRLCR